MTGFNSKRDAVADKLQEPDALTIAYQSGFYDGKKAALAQPVQKPINLLEARKIAAEYGTPDLQIDSGNLYFALMKCLEHIDAQPTQEPVAYVTGMSFGRFIVEPLNRAMVLPVGMALYSAPQGNT